MNKQEILSALARILPDVIHFDKVGTFGFTKYKGMGLMWIEENRPVRDTELRHLVDLAEAKLPREQVTSYVTELRGFPAPANWEGCMGLHQTVEVCVLALTRVHATEEQV